MTIAFIGPDILASLISTSTAMTSIAALATMPSTVPDENTDPSATANGARSSPEKRTCPSTPNLQLPQVCRQALQENMSSPTSPCAPTDRQQTPAGTKRRLASRCSTLTTGNESQFTLEVGANAFYFTMELSPRKITPTRDMFAGKRGALKTREGPMTPTGAFTPSSLRSRTPVKRNRKKTMLDTPTKAIIPKQDTKTSTPIRKTPSPRKNHSPAKQSANRTLFETPSKKKKQSTPNTGRPSSPVKRTIELDSPSSSVDSQPARNLASQPDDIFQTLSERLADVATEEDVAVEASNKPAIPVPSEDFVLVKKTRTAARLQPENIGHLMAKLGSSSVAQNQEWTCAEGMEGGAASPTPTPLRKAWEKLQLADSLSFRRISNDVQAESGTTPVVEGTGRECSADTWVGAQPTHTASTSSYGSLLTPATSELPDTMELPTMHYPKPSLKNIDGDTRADSANYVYWQDNGDCTLDISKGQSISLQKRIGSDNSVIWRPQKDREDTQMTLRRSSEIFNPGFFESPDLSDLPPIPDTRCIGDQEDGRGLGAVEIHRDECRYDGDMLSLARMATGSPKRVPLPKGSSTPSVPRCRLTIKTPRQKKMNLPVISKRPAVASAAADGIKLTGMKPPVKTPSSAKPLSTPVKQTIPINKRTPPKSVSRIPLATPTKPRRYTTATPQGAPRYIPTEATSKPPPTLKYDSSSLKLPRPTPTRKPLQQVKYEPHDLFTIPRPPQPKFAGGLDIKWHSDDSRKLSKSPSRTNLAGKATPKVAKNVFDKEYTTKTPAKFQAGIVVVPESTTPEGSPPTTTTTDPSTNAPPSTTRTQNLTPRLSAVPIPRLSPTPTHKQAIHPPKIRISAVTPKRLPPPIVTTTTTNSKRECSSSLLSTPTKIPVPGRKKSGGGEERDGVDRNANRRPSRDIIGSLDRAIDEKIAEDRRQRVGSGVYFELEG